MVLNVGAHTGLRLAMPPQWRPFGNLTILPSGLFDSALWCSSVRQLTVSDLAIFWAILSFHVDRFSYQMVNRWKTVPNWWMSGCSESAVALVLVLTSAVCCSSQAKPAWNWQISGTLNSARTSTYGWHFSTSRTLWSSSVSRDERPIL